MFLIKPLKENILDPDSKQPLRMEGIRVESVSTYYFRRERDKDVSITAIEEQAAPKPESPKQKKGV